MISTVLFIAVVVQGHIPVDGQSVIQLMSQVLKAPHVHPAIDLLIVRATTKLNEIVRLLCH